MKIILLYYFSLCEKFVAVIYLSILLRIRLATLSRITAAYPFWLFNHFSTLNIGKVGRCRCYSLGESLQGKGFIRHGVKMMIKQFEFPGLCGDTE
jgi:hypothetical protein